MLLTVTGVGHTSDSKTNEPQYIWMACVPTSFMIVFLMLSDSFYLNLFNDIDDVIIEILICL